MKIHCKNGCGKTVRRPRSPSWKEYSICPNCYDHMINLHITHESIVRDDIIPKVTNPVDQYWHMLTLRELHLNKNR